MIQRFRLWKNPLQRMTFVSFEEKKKRIRNTSFILHLHVLTLAKKMGMYWQSHKLAWGWIWWQCLKLINWMHLCKKNVFFTLYSWFCSNFSIIRFYPLCKISPTTQIPYLSLLLWCFHWKRKERSILTEVRESFPQREPRHSSFLCDWISFKVI